MKIAEVTKEIIGKKCKMMWTGMIVNATITRIEENENSVQVWAIFDEGHQWGNDTWYKAHSFARKSDGWGSLQYLQLV